MRTQFCINVMKSIIEMDTTDGVIAGYREVFGGQSPRPGWCIEPWGLATQVDSYCVDVFLYVELRLLLVIYFDDLERTTSSVKETMSGNSKLACMLTSWTRAVTWCASLTHSLTH